jgi:hypothetical protein
MNRIVFLPFFGLNMAAKVRFVSPCFQYSLLGRRMVAEKIDIFRKIFRAA